MSVSPIAAKSSLPEDDVAPADGDARTRTRKAPNAFRTISEVADDLHIPQHVLRFWETKFPQVKPLKRGGGRRYYRPDDIALLRRISGLLYVQGYTIKGVQRLLREGGGQLSDDIPPPTPDEKAEAEALDVHKLQDVQLPMPGLIPLDVVPSTKPPRVTKSEPAKPSRAEADMAVAMVAAHAEIAHLRGLLAETLAELEAIRALLA
jgi:DNA-binding transcriptional MerR regulator